MPYCLKRGFLLGEEVRRLYVQQLTAAVEILCAAKGRDGVYACRKHVKKARALLDMAAGKISSREARRELRVANNALSALSDAYRVTGLVDDLEGLDDTLVSDALLSRLRSALMARCAVLEHRAAVHGDREKVARLLVSARSRAAEWDVAAIDSTIVIGAVADAHRRARRARRLAMHHHNVERFHQWRRRVKAEWYLFRLTAEHTGGRLIDDQHRLAALDARLGRLHDVSVLAAIISGAPLLSRHESAKLLRALRRFSSDLRRSARVLSIVLDDRPKAVKQRLTGLWGVHAAPPSAEESSCPVAA